MSRDILNLHLCKPRRREPRDDEDHKGSQSECAQSQCPRSEARQPLKATEDPRIRISPTARRLPSRAVCVQNAGGCVSPRQPVGIRDLCLPMTSHQVNGQEARNHRQYTGDSAREACGVGRKSDRKEEGLGGQTESRPLPQQAIEERSTARHSGVDGVRAGMKAVLGRGLACHAGRMARRRAQR